MDGLANFAYTKVATAPSPATSGTSLVVTTGDGANLPTVPFNGTVWPRGVVPLPSNAEIVRVTAISTDTLTIVRAQEGTSARTIVAGDQFAAAVTAGLLGQLGGNLLKNGGAESGATTPWLTTADADSMVTSGATLAADTNDFNTQSGSAHEFTLSIPVTNTLHRGMRQDITGLEPNTTYIFKAFIKKGTYTSSCLVAVRDVTNSVVVNSGSITPTTQWVPYAVAVTTGATGNVTLRVVIEADVDSQAAGTILVDDCYLTRLTETKQIPSNLVVGTAGLTFSKGSYPGLRAVRVRCVGGGGAGGGAASGATHSAGSGGGGGAYAESIIKAGALASSETVTVGAGGTGVSAGTGNSGGTTSFGSWVSAGGGGGGLASGNNATLVTHGAAGGAASAGDIQVHGGPGGNMCGTDSTRVESGQGGDSALGGGGTAAHTPTDPGAAGNAYGGGGAGSNTTTAAGTGGAGADGVCIIELIY